MTDYCTYLQVRLKRNFYVWGGGQWKNQDREIAPIYKPSSALSVTG